MNKVIFGIITILLLINIACVSIAPCAYIDAISPPTVSLGEPVTFSGHGTDADGIIIGYEWRSSMDGVLSTVADFTTSSLSAGTHTIYFRVLDSQNMWSEAVSGVVTVTAEVARPVINTFTAIPDSILRGGSLELSWSVSGAETVSIDNGIGQVDAVGSKTLYPSGNTVYTLTALNEGGSVTATTTVMVLESPVVVGDPVIDFTADYLGGNSWQLNWNVLNATQIAIQPDIGPVGPTGSIVVTIPSGQIKTYRLEAINDWGWAYWQVMVGSP